MTDKKKTDRHGKLGKTQTAATDRHREGQFTFTDIDKQHARLAQRQTDRLTEWHRDRMTHTEWHRQNSLTQAHRGLGQQEKQ